MRLDELAYCCHVYAVLGGYDDALAELRQTTGPTVDPARPDNIGPLFTWLRRWGCRQFAIADEAVARENLEGWWQAWRGRLPGAARTLAKLNDRDLDAIAGAFDDLRLRQASWQRTGTRTFAKTFGATGTAKALFAIRPNSCPPWDEPIRIRLGFAGTGEGYRQHLVRIRTEIEEAVADLGPGHAAADIPAALGRKGASLAKLVDEHDWVRFTHGTEPPPRELFERWAGWAGRV